MNINKKIIALAISIAIVGVGTMYSLMNLGQEELTLGAPVSNFFRNVLPRTDKTYDLVTTTPANEWNNIFTKDVAVSVTCTGCGAGGAGIPNVILTTVDGTTYLQASTTANAWLFNTGFVSQASSTNVGDLTITGTTTLDTVAGVCFTFSAAHGSGILFTETNAVFNSIDSMGFFADTDADGGGNYFPSLQLIIGSTKGIELTLNDDAGNSNFRILSTGGAVFVVD